jgi:hypothetical protein
LDVLGENHQHAALYWQTLSQNVVSSTPHLSAIWTLWIAKSHPNDSKHSIRNNLCAPTLSTFH